MFAFYSIICNHVYLFEHQTEAERYVKTRVQ